MTANFFRPIAAAILLCFLAMQAGAQTEIQREKLATWQATATRATTVLEAELASNPALEVLRAELAEQRAAAQEMFKTSSAAALSITEQLTALGPAPENGTEESAEITAFREETAAALARANAPALEADLAYRRANDLIARIDTLIRARINEELTSLGPTPLNPVLWAEAITKLSKFWYDVGDEIRATVTQPVSRAQIIQRLPFAALAFFASLVLLFGARPFVLRRLVPLLEAAETPNKRLGWALLMNLSRIVIPGLAAFGIIWAVNFSEIAGFWGSTLTDLFPAIAVMAIAAYWLGNSLTGGRWATRDFGIVSAEFKAPAQRIIAVLSLTLIVKVILDAIDEKMVLAPGVSSALDFPVVLVGSFFLYRASRLMKISIEASTDEGFNATFLRFIRRAIFLISIVAPILAAVGYFAAARFLLYPAIISLALIGTAYVIFAIFTELLEGWFGNGINDNNQDPDGATDLDTSQTNLRLLPVVFGFAIVLITLPFLALTWGARVSDLTEIWVLLNDGIPLGESRISLTVIFVFALVFFIGYTLTGLLKKVFRTSVLPRTRMDTGGKTAVLSGISYVGFTLAALAAISATGIDLSSLAIVAGALSVGIGFGMQNIVSNFVSGIILLIERPIKEGDWIEAGAYSGYVRRIAVRSTMIETFERSLVIVPNSDLVAGPVLNWTHTNMVGRTKVQVGVAYGTDPRLVEKILYGIAEAHPMVLRDPVPSVIFVGFGADSLDFEMRAYLRDVNWMLSAKSDMNFEVVRQFAAHDIEIPFAQRDINLKNIDELGAAIRGEKDDTQN